MNYWILGGIAGIIFVYLAAIYNKFIALRNGIESNFKQIQVALKKRMDLINQVVDSVKGEMKFEKDTLTQITRLRSQAAGELTPGKAKEFDASSSKLLAGLKVQVENYPNLKANENVKQLIQSINELEEEVSRLRYVYNNTIQEFNTKLQSFPTNFIGTAFGFSREKYLEFDSEAISKTPKINLNS
jgi:LemA protein